MVVSQHRSTVRVPFVASGIDSYFNFCLGICSNRKFYYLSSFLFKTILIRKFFPILKHTSVMYKVLLCSCFCLLKLHRISLIPHPFNSSTENSMQLLYHSFLLCTPFPAIPSILHRIYSPVPHLIRPFTTLATCLWAQLIY